MENVQSLDTSQATPVMEKRISCAWILTACMLFSISVAAHSIMQNKIDLFKGDPFRYPLCYASLSSVRVCTVAFSAGALFACILRALFRIVLSNRRKKIIIAVAAVTGFFVIGYCVQWLLYLCMTEDVVHLPLWGGLIARPWSVVVAAEAALVVGFAGMLLIGQQRR